MLHACLTLVAFTLAATPGSAARFSTEAHAHNDYAHARPLYDALEHHFASVEADIFLVDGQLLVGHTRGELSPDRTLESLYLKPLMRRVRELGGVYGEDSKFTLFIDVKTEASSTYAALRPVLASYRPMLTEHDASHAIERAVTVVLSGNRATNAVAEDSPRLCAIDGRLADLDATVDAALMPIISDNWATNFAWRGEGKLSPLERDKLRRIVERAHAAGRRVRFWGTSESRAMWNELSGAQVDLINTDKLPELAMFLADRTNVEEKPLFADGSFDGWKCLGGQPPADSWEIVDGVLHLKAAHGKNSSLVTTDEIGDFEWSFDWKIAAKGNSGVKYRVRDYGGRVLGCEYQMYDDSIPIGNPKAKNKNNAAPKDKTKNLTAALYDLYSADPNKVLNPPGEFNHARIVVRGDRIEHWLNGQLVMTAIVGSDEWKSRVAASKFNDAPGFGENRTGRLMITDHGGESWFKNMVIRRLDAPAETR